VKPSLPTVEEIEAELARDLERTVRKKTALAKKTRPKRQSGPVAEIA
jgi:hypothetical protein